MSRHHIVVDPDKEIYMKCHDCQMWGSPSYLFLEKCGNCHSENVSIYYPRLKEERLTKRPPDGLTPGQSEQVRQMIQNALDTGSA